MFAQPFNIEMLLSLAVTFEHFEILRAIGKGSFGKVSVLGTNQRVGSWRCSWVEMDELEAHMRVENQSLCTISES